MPDLKLAGLRGTTTPVPVWAKDGTSNIGTRSTTPELCSNSQLEREFRSADTTHQNGPTTAVLVLRGDVVTAFSVWVGASLLLGCAHSS